MKNCLKWSLIVVVFFSSCKKEDAVIPQPVLPAAKGIYVLTEGTFGGNNSKLAFRDAASSIVYPDFFVQQNPAQAGGLGDTGNDMLIYGGKIYIVMNNSANVTVLDAATGTFLARISFLNGTVNRSPRFAAGARGKVFVTSYDNSVSVIDTSLLTISSTITVGSNPEHIIATDNYLYVANSGGLNYPDVDSTVSMIDLNTLTEVAKVTVGLNPQRLEENAQGNIIVSGYGLAFVPQPVPAFVRMFDPQTRQVIPTPAQEFSHVRSFGNNAYVFSNYGGSILKVLNASTLDVVRDNFVTDGTVVTNVYAVDVDEQNGDVFICDSKDFVSGGEVFCFDQAGRKKYSFSVAPGISPNKVAFLR